MATPLPTLRSPAQDARRPTSSLLPRRQHRARRPFQQRKGGLAPEAQAFQGYAGHPKAPKGCCWAWLHSPPPGTPAAAAGRCPWRVLGCGHVPAPCGDGPCQPASGVQAGVIPPLGKPFCSTGGRGRERMSPSAGATKTAESETLPRGPVWPRRDALPTPADGSLPLGAPALLKCVSAAWEGTLKIREL